MRLPRPQLHLSTCIVLMFVAGGLLLVNLPGRWIETAGGSTVRFWGWPLHFFEEWAEYTLAEAEINPGIIHWYRLSIDVLTALAILAAVAFGCEWIIRRRRKPEAGS